MFLKNNSRPAYAFASASAGSMDKQSKSEKKTENFAFAASQSNDFNSFSSSASNQGRAPKAPKKKKVTFEIPGRRIAIVAAIVVGIVLIIALASGLLFSKSNDVVYEDNAFASYKDTDGSYYIVMNGKIIKDVFADEIELIPAKDNSFAYVFATVEGENIVYVLDDNKLTPICKNVDEVLSVADYKPGVVYKFNGDQILYYYDNSRTLISTKNGGTPENFVISPDGTAVAYTTKNKNDATINDLYVYNADQSVPKMLSTGTVSMTPVSVSNNGVYVVAYAEKGENRALYLLTKGDRHKISGVDGIYDSVIATNADSTEIVFTTKTASGVRSYVYDCTNMKKETTTAYHVGNGYAIPQIIDSKVCTLESFKQCYFMIEDAKAPMTVYLSKKGEAIKVCDYTGKIDPDGRFLYIKGAKADEESGPLYRIKLLGERTKKDAADVENYDSIARDVKDFVITNKGNIYYINGYDMVAYYKTATKKLNVQQVSGKVESFDFYTYANQLVFEMVDDKTGITTVYMTEEGSDAEEFKFDGATPLSCPTITNPYSKKTYAYYYDETSGGYALFYTSNGKTFKKIDDCEAINFSHDNSFDDLRDFIEDQLNDLKDAIEDALTQ